MAVPSTQDHTSTVDLRSASTSRAHASPETTCASSCSPSRELINTSSEVGDQRGVALPCRPSKAVAPANTRRTPKRDSNFRRWTEVLGDRTTLILASSSIRATSDTATYLEALGFRDRARSTRGPGRGVGERRRPSGGPSGDRRVPRRRAGAPGQPRLPPGSCLRRPLTWGGPHDAPPLVQPEPLVVGGGVAHALDLMADDIREVIRRDAMEPFRERASGPGRPRRELWAGGLRRTRGLRSGRFWNVSLAAFGRAGDVGGLFRNALSDTLGGIV